MKPDGSWQLVVDSPVGKQKVLVELREEDGQLTGVLTNQSMNVSTEIFEGSVDDTELRWKAQLRQLKMTLAFSVTVKDDTMEGKVKAGMFGNFKVVGERTAG